MFEFLVELKRASWALKDVFQLLKKCKMLSVLLLHLKSMKFSDQQKYESAEMRQLQVFR